MGDINFELCGQQFVAVEKTNSEDDSLWRYPEVDDNEHKEIDPLAPELPESILIDGQSYSFSSVPKKGTAAPSNIFDARYIIVSLPR